MSRLEKISNIRGKIKLITGLHIGGGTEAIEIGGIDNPVIKDTKSGLPIIPGSSIKGKIRSLLEIKNGKTSSNGGPCGCGTCEICKAFGSGANSKNNNGTITRLIFRDLFLSQDSIDLLLNNSILATEAKMENTINRFKGTAEHPRTSERVIAGLIFDFEVAIRVFEGDNDSSINLLKEGLLLLEKDALGGSGSRGYGKIEFQNLKLDEKEFNL